MQKTQTASKKPIFLIIFLILVIVSLFFLIRHFSAKPEEPVPHEPPAVLQPQTPKAKDVPRILEPGAPMDENISEEMQERKDSYGVKDGVDMIVTSEESVRVGNEVLNMRDFETQDALSRGEIVAEPLDGEENGKNVQNYGIYVVQPGENIWSIHYKFLKEYLTAKGIKLPPAADKPNPDGSSSGVGKVLKFSERIVRIYNMKTKTFSDDINMIQPYEKIVVYNMERLTSLLDSLTAENLNQIRFDGESIWISAP